MSAIEKLSPGIDNRLNVGHQYDQHVKLIPANVQYNLTNSDGAAGFNQQIVFSQIVQPSVESVILGRDVRVLYNLTVSAPSASQDQNCIKLPKANYDSTYEQHACLTSFPLNASSSTITLQINGQSTGVSQQQITGSLQRCLNRKKLMLQGSECPNGYDDRAVLVNDTTQYGYIVLPEVYAAAIYNLRYNNAATPYNVNLSAAAAYGANVAGNTFNIILGNTATAVVGTITFPAVQQAVNYGFCPFLKQNSVSNQVLSKYENSLRNNRGSFLPWSYTDDGTTSTWQFVVSEPVLVSPFSPLEDHEVSLANTNTMSLTFTINSLQSMLYSNIPYTTPTITISQPRLQLTYFQVEEIKIPKIQMVDYTAINYFPQTFTGVNLSGTNVAQLVGQQIRLVNMPRKILVLARLPLDKRYTSVAGETINGTATTLSTSLTDTFISIGNPTSGLAGTVVNIGTRQVFASASTADLWRMSVKNGVDVSWQQWSKGGNCVWAFEPEDFGLSMAQGDVFPGMIGTASNNNIQVNLTINGQSLQYAGASALVPGTNLTELTVEMLVVPLYQGSCSISPGDALFSLGNLTMNQVKATFEQGDASGYVPDEMIKRTINGGGIFGTVKHLFSMGAKGVKMAHKLASHPIAQKALDYASAMGGEGGALGGALHMSRKKRGGVLSTA